MGVVPVPDLVGGAGEGLEELDLGAEGRVPRVCGEEGGEEGRES